MDSERLIGGGCRWRKPGQFDAETKLVPDPERGGGTGFGEDPQRDGPGKRLTHCAIAGPFLHKPAVGGDEGADEPLVFGIGAHGEA